MSELTASQIHRAAGVLLGMACGDALGAGYEFGPPIPEFTPVMMGGGSGPWGEGQWTDDTDMAVVIAQAAAAGLDLRSPEAHDRLAAQWYGWSVQSMDVGTQTRTVLDDAHDQTGGVITGAALLAASSQLHADTGHTAGNGSLMRTAPVALAYLHDVDGLIEAATQVSQLTHFDPDAGEACVLWCLAIRHAVLTGELDITVGLDALKPPSQRRWERHIATAEHSRPDEFTRNGWVVEAFQGAWSAINLTRGAGEFHADHLRLGVEAAVRGGRDADTVAAIAGSLLGAAYGASAVPSYWSRLLYGWPGLRARDLVHLSVLVATDGAGDGARWPTMDVFDYSHWGDVTRILEQHPHDPGVMLGGVDSVRALPDGVDAVVSLCRLGIDEAPAAGVEPGNHIEVWLVDDASREANPHLEFVLADVAGIIAQLRAEGRTVLVHCVGSKSRTPTASILHSMAVTGMGFDDALAELRVAVPTAQPNAGFEAALRAGILLPGGAPIANDDNGDADV